MLHGNIKQDLHADSVDVISGSLEKNPGRSLVLKSKESVDYHRIFQNHEYVCRRTVNAHEYSPDGVPSRFHRFRTGLPLLDQSPRRCLTGLYSHIQIYLQLC